MKAFALSPIHACLVLSAALTAAVLAVAPAARPARPSVLYIVVDDLRVRAYLPWPLAGLITVYICCLVGAGRAADVRAGEYCGTTPAGARCAWDGVRPRLLQPAGLLSISKLVHERPSERQDESLEFQEHLSRGRPSLDDAGADDVSHTQLPLPHLHFRCMVETTAQTLCVALSFPTATSRLTSLRTTTSPSELESCTTRTSLLMAMETSHGLTQLSSSPVSTPALVATARTATPRWRPARHSGPRTPHTHGGASSHHQTARPTETATSQI